MSKHAVFGAGPIGSAVATILSERGEQVVIASRSGRGPASVERVAVDAADAASVARIADGASAIYNCLNPAYHRWAKDWPPMAEGLIAASRSTGAVLVTVSNLYGYGPVSGPLVEDLSLAAQGRKGRVRAEMYRRALAEHEAGRIRMVEIRASDYVGPRAESHLGERTVPKVMRGARVSVVGSADQPHTWTYTGDVATCAVAVAGQERAWGRAWHVPSNEPRTQREALADFASLAGAPAPRVSGIPRTMLAMAGVFSPTIRELRETEYQFSRPFVMDSTAAQEAFGLEPTAWNEIVAETARSYGWAGQPVG